MHAHVGESTAATGTTAVATPVNTIKGVAVVEEEMVQSVDKVEEDAERVVEKGAEAIEAVAEVAGADGSKVWKQVKGRFDTFRTF